MKLGVWDTVITNLNEENAKRLKESLMNLEGILEVNFEMSVQAVEIKYDKDKISKEEIKNKIVNEGFEVI